MDWVELRYLGERHKDNGHRLCYRSDFSKYQSEKNMIYPPVAILYVWYSNLLIGLMTGHEKSSTCASEEVSVIKSVANSILGNLA